MPGRAESGWSVCSGTAPRPFQSEYCYTSISQMQESTYSAYFCLSVQQAHYLLLCGWDIGGGQLGHANRALKLCSGLALAHWHISQLEHSNCLVFLFFLRLQNNSHSSGFTFQHVVLISDYFDFEFHKRFSNQSCDIILVMLI